MSLSLDTPVDVIVPVYRGLDDTRRCLESVLSCRCRQRYELIAIDDCSPEAEVSAYLDGLAREGHITLLRNPSNRGFVATVNRGMALHPDRDVVLLNSDTEVANDWLDRLMTCACSVGDAATITPFSNNATICSYPCEGWMGEVPGTLGLAGLDALFARELNGVVADLPTAVGFCMYIRRACLVRIGAFDEASFGRGYGEENDFSLRAAKAGWRNILCADVFVYHRGGVSFGEERSALQRSAEQTLLAKHPDYNERVRAFLLSDPLRSLRETIDRARARLGGAEAMAVMEERRAELEVERCRSQAAASPVPEAPAPVGWRGTGLGAVRRESPRHRRPVLLHVAHSWGGGVERWLRDFTAADDASWNLVLRSQTGRNDAGVGLELLDLAEDRLLATWRLETPIQATDLSHAEYRAILGSILASLPVEAVLVSSLIGHALDALDTGLPSVVVLHDLYPFCPALFGWFGGACERCDGGALRRCFEENALNVFWQCGNADAWLQLREAYARLLTSEHVRIVAPSEDVHARYARLYPVLRGKHWSLVPHGLAGPLSWPFARSRPALSGADAGTRLRVVVPGRLMPHKGLMLLRELLLRLGDCAEFLLLGSGEHGRTFAGLEHVRVVEDYANEDLRRQVEAYAPDCALLLSLLPETYSYTLSEMWALGVPVVATRRGSFVERIEEGETGFLVEPDVESVSVLLRSLAQDRRRLGHVAERLTAKPVRSAAEMVDAYRRLLGVSGRSDGGSERGLPLVAAAVETLSAVIDSERSQSASLREQLAREGATNADLARWAKDLEAALIAEQDRSAELARRLCSLEARYEAMLASHSWRVTAPLRAISEGLRGRGRLEGDAAGGEGQTEAGRDDERASVGAPSGAAPEAVAVPGKQLRFLQGDPIAARRAQQLGELWGVAATADFVDGGSLLVDIHEAAGSRCVLCLEGVEDGRGGAFREAGRLVLPGEAVQSHLTAELQPVEGVVRVLPFPLAGDWSQASSRAESRRCRREALGVPDRTRLVLGIGRADANSGMLRFVRAAAATIGRRNDVCFVWLGGSDGEWLKANWLEIGPLVSMRRLFLVDEPDFESWLLAADAYLGCRAEGVYDAGAVEALAAGLPVVVATDSVLADVVPKECLDECVMVARGDDVPARLAAAWSEPERQARRDERARGLVARLGGQASFDAFAAACGNDGDHLPAAVAAAMPPCNRTIC